MSDQVFGDDFDDEDDFESRGSSGGMGGKRLILILLAVLAVIAIVAGVFLSGVLDDVVGGDSGPQVETSAAVEAPAGSQSQGGADQPAGPGVEYYELPSILVNLNSQNNRNSFLRLVVIMELGQGSSVSSLENATPKLIDAFQLYLRNLTPQELQGSAGMYRLKEDLIDRATKQLEPFGVNVTDILVKEMLVQ